MKKLLAIILAVVLVVAMVPAVAVLADNDPTIKVESAEGLRGSEVDVKITLENNPGIVSAKLNVAYDASVLEVVSKTAGSAFATMANGPFTANPFVVNWVDSISPDNAAVDFVTIKFKIKDDAALGESAITVTYDPADVFNATMADVEFAVENGAVNVISCKHEKTTETKENEKALSCTQDECYDKVVTCDECGEIVSKETVVVKATEGHKWGADHKCSVCGESRFTGPTILVTGATGLEKDTVDVKITLENNPGIVSAKLNVAYDADVLEVVSKTAGSAYATMANGPLTANPFVVNWVDSISPDNAAVDFVTITFKIKEGAALGESAITVTYDPADVFNAAMVDVAFAVENGAVKVIDCEHKNVTESKDNEKALTCTQDECYDKVVTCDDCGAVISRETITVKKAEGHKPEDKNAKAPTCTEAGKEADKVCSVCGEVLSTGAAIDATGHTAGEAVKENEVAPKCQEDGSYDEVVYCTVCNAELSRTPKTVDATGHTAGEAVKENEVAPKCEEAGSYDEVVYCTVCNAELSRTPKTVDATGHTAGEAVKENIVGNICTEKGSYDEVVYCTVCNKELSRDNKEVEAIGHDEMSVNAHPATCTEEGYTGDTVCVVCSEELVKGEVIPATGHTEKVVGAKEATCTEKGYTGDKVCEVCEEVLEEGEDIDALGHKYGDWKVVKEATATENGSKEKTCENCGDVVTEEIPAQGTTPPAAEQTPSAGEQTPPTTDAPASTDKVSPPTNDVANIFVVVAMLAAAAVASVVVLKKKA